MDEDFLNSLVLEAIRTQGGGEHDGDWRRGDLTHLLHSGQKKIQKIFEANHNQVQVVLCSRGFGKTYWAASIASSQAIKKSKSRVKIATEFQTDLEALILPNFDQVLDTCPDDIKPQWRASKSRFIGTNGSAIDLIGLDRKPNGLRGQHNVDLIILEEAGFISKLEKLHRSVIVPMTTHRPNCKIILNSTPPESPDHYFWTLSDKAEDAGALTRLTIDDNPMLTPDDIKRIEDEMGGRDSVQFQREYLCKRIIDTNLAILPEWTKVHADIIRPTHNGKPPFYKPIVAIDLGLNDNCGVVFGYWDFDKAKAVVEAELLLNGVNSEELTKRCLEIEHRLWGDLTPMRWADGSLYTINDICSVHKYNVSPVRKDIVEAQVNHLRLMLQSRQVEIYDSCKQLIRQCGGGIWNKQKTEFARVGSNHQDLLASLIYMVRHLNKENPYPPNYRYDRDSMHYRGSQTPSHLESLKKTFSQKGRAV